MFVSRYFAVWLLSINTRPLSAIGMLDSGYFSTYLLSLTKPPCFKTTYTYKFKKQSNSMLLSLVLSNKLNVRFTSGNLKLSVYHVPHCDREQEGIIKYYCCASRLLTCIKICST